MTTNKVSGSCGALQQMTGNIEAQLLVGGGGRQFSQYTLIMKIKQIRRKGGVNEGKEENNI